MCAPWVTWHTSTRWSNSSQTMCSMSAGIWLPCGCVLCDPGCTVWRIVINAVAAADSVHYACVRWEINFLLTFETALFFCVYAVYPGIGPRPNILWRKIFSEHTDVLLRLSHWSVTQHNTAYWTVPCVKVRSFASLDTWQQMTALNKRVFVTKSNIRLSEVRYKKVKKMWIK
jgi:hypothetical protein